VAELLAITLAQPWPWAVTTLGKKLENRYWTDKRLQPGTFIAIHGGKTPKPGLSQPYQLFEDALHWIKTESPAPLSRRDAFVPLEGIVAIARIDTIYKPNEGLAPRHIDQRGWRAKNIYGESDQYAFVFDVIVLPTPVKVSGSQKLWTVQGDVLEQVRAQYQAAKEGAA
jgi:hypothetical protein